MKILFKDNDSSQPFKLFKNFYDHALSCKQQYIDAICISSYNINSSEISSRFVNLKKVEENKLVFFSNYDSPKASDFSFHEQVAVTLHWEKIDLQIRIKGIIKKLDPKESDKHFHERSFKKNILAISSSQSKKIKSYEEVLLKYQRIKKENENKSILNRPINWGGYCVSPYFFEFWQGNKDRINKRTAYNLDKNVWISSVLEP